MKIQGKIEGATQPKKWNNVLQIGFKIADRWFNIPGEENQLQEYLKTMIRRGNEIEFDLDDKNQISNLKVTKEAPEENENWQDDIVNFEDLLDAAHMNGLVSIETQLIEKDISKKYALFKAVVTGTKGRYEAHGDATDDNLESKMIKPHFIRMAETRAIARALRWYTNNAKVADVETGKVNKVPEVKK
jgi:hypothetical protein